MAAGILFKVGARCSAAAKVEDQTDGIKLCFKVCDHEKPYTGGLN